MEQIAAGQPCSAAKVNRGRRPKAAAEIGKTNAADPAGRTKQPRAAYQAAWMVVGDGSLAIGNGFRGRAVLSLAITRSVGKMKR
ncbi:hypothetical protein [Falsiroseomonas sp.]|uniref:hypothetical protein n=1 Tax=Falsiroseomonas sp. TaxID=2870721 RepID=UPI003564EB50